MALNKLKQKFLNQSDMYNFYKKEYEDRNRKLEEFDRLIQTHQDFLNNLFIYYNHKPTPFLTNMRKLSLEFLKFFDNLCKKHELEYWLDYGTLLGAVRHGGFIPWDDDLDVAMMRKDYIKFIEILPDELESFGLNDIEYYFKTAKCNNKSDRWFQFSYKLPQFSDKFIGLDIFPHDFVKDYDGQDLNEKYAEFALKYYKNPDTMTLDDFVHDFYNEFNLTFDKTDYILPGCESLRGDHLIFKYSHAIIKTDEIFPLANVKFGPYEFKAPNDSISYLKGIYGKNIMKVPKVFEDHGRLNRFRNQENIDELLYECYQIIKEVNQKF